MTYQEITDYLSERGHRITKPMVDDIESLIAERERLARLAELERFIKDILESHYIRLLDNPIDQVIYDLQKREAELQQQGGQL